ncbi:hypothetical protein EW026_g2343 [Hermanssonia centrifuga]|uniref:DUF6533 domain-containing protein n=1 Tax=Hermanssonia centrifuga TaxID=98765 RepID=A0A4S4KPL3_9APHY|nr:hypothetical protein EW026_g2343 [Hermanssonia centrifuga]
MSDPTADAQIIEELQVQQIEIFLIWSVTALVTYEYVITIHNEITMVWRKKWTIATWLFILNRYLLIAYTLLTVVPYSAQFSNLVNLAQFIVFALFSALRAFVIYNFNIPILVLVFLLNIVPVATNIWSTSTGSVPIPSTYLPTSILTVMAILTGLAMIAGDVVVLIVTWITTYKPLREARELKISNTLGGVFLRDGTLYFIALLTLNIAQICFQNIPSIQNSSASPVVIYVQV